MKFKVGDKVKIKEKIENYHGIGKEILSKMREGDNVWTIKKISKGEKYDYYHLKEDPLCYSFGEDMLERVEYTYEDLKKSPIGTKITLEKIQDKQLVKTAPNRIENDDYGFFIGDFEGLNTSNYGRIIKIEEPEYTTVYEAKVEILDDVEKRYLRGVIRPFRNNVEVIRKLFSPTKGKYYIQIKYKDEPPTNLPYFESKEMYKNMKIDRIYTLEEVEL